VVQVCLLAVVTACQDSTSKQFYPSPAVGRGAMAGEDETNEPEEPEPTPEAMAERARAELRKAGGDDRAVHGAMQENFVRADQLQKAIVAGDLDEARETARWIATHSPTGGLPDGWLAHVTALRRAAQSVVDARDIDAAAHGTAFVAGACGSCHLAQLGGAQLGAEPLPQHGDGLELAMRRHQWAADRWWDAVVSGKGGLWEDGVEVLAASELVAGDFDAKAEQRAKLTRLLKRLRGIVKRGEGAVAPDHRVQVLGDFLSTCSSCHRLLERGPEAW
jgi:hypothetical protein